MEEPMTVYSIDDVRGDKIWAKSLLVKNEMVHGWPVPEEYDNNIPKDAIQLPSDSWDWGKKEMLSFIKKTFDYLCKMAIKEKSQIKIGGHYVGGHGGIHTVTEIADEKVKFREFRLDEDDISPCWTGEVNSDDTDRWYAISEETYEEVYHRYDEFLTRLRERFCGISS